MKAQSIANVLPDSRWIGACLGRAQVALRNGREADIVALPVFRIISARKAIRVLQQFPKRTPGIGLRAWGTGASAEVNVHISVMNETKSWEEIFERVRSSGLSDIIRAVNRKRTELVFDPEI